MPNVRTQNAFRRREAQPINHPLSVNPCHADHGWKVKTLGFFGKNMDDALELVEFDAVKLPVAIRRIDSMCACGVQSPDIFAEDILIEAILRVKRCGDGGPYAM